jgi:hypothetical protein
MEERANELHDLFGPQTGIGAGRRERRAGHPGHRGVLWMLHDRRATMLFDRSQANCPIAPPATQNNTDNLLSVGFSGGDE